MLIHFAEALRSGALASLLIAPAYAASATDPPDEAALTFYTEEVYPLLEEHCLRCHGGGTAVRGGLDLATAAGLAEGGESGPAFDPANPDASFLLEMLSYKDELHEMPPKGKLPDAEIDIIREWLRMGAPMPAMPEDATHAKADPAHTSPYKTEINDETRNWWSYRPVVKPTPPAVAEAAWAENPIDAFIYAGYAERGVRPVGEASRQVLIRRVYYGLTGLPPTPEDVAAFVADPDPAAYEKLIDRLLASPHYGEKWGRHWLDLVRYAETNGYERDNPKPHIWRYRDYVIDAFNQDKPYDRFIREQIAGDELPDGGREGIIATGFYRLGLWDDEPVDKMQGRYDVLDGVVSTTSEVFLGTTMGCARCHDHKIDPIPQKDYYRLLSFVDNVTDMQTTAITRSLLTGEEAAQYEARKKKHESSIARRERHLKSLERDFLAAYEAHLAVSAPSMPSDISGLRYRFYRDTWERLPNFEEIKFETEATLDHGFIDIGERTRDEAFGFVFEGTLHVPETGDYVFTLVADDGARIIVGNTVVIDHDGANLLETKREVTVHLDAGNPALRVEYFQKDRKFGLHIFWRGPHFENRPLTAETPTYDLPALIAEHGDALLGAGFAERYARSHASVGELRALPVPGGEFAACVAERGSEAPQTFVHFRGNPNVPGDPVQPGFPAVLGFDDPPAATPAPDGKSTGRRLQLADWLARPDNPLTSRVMANRIWQYHFGRGLVRTPNDFGQAGSPPTHPELLDWLAADFVEGGWTLKRMHRQILLSKTYRLASTGDTENLARDPINDSFWRFDMRRLTAEEVRDSMLAVAGNLNLKLGGPSVYPPMPLAALQTSSRPEEAWQKSPPEEHGRRSIYIHVKRSLLTPLLTDFDLADTDNSCPVRFATTQPTQALNLLNSEIAAEQAQHLAARLAREADTPAEQVRRALALVTERTPTDDEVRDALALLDELQTKHGLAPQVALERFALFALNLNEFLFLD